MASRDDAIGEALCLRAFALGVLGGAVPPGATRAMAACGPAAWSLFLQTECCALPLLGRLPALGLLDRLPAAARAVLQQAAAAESQRVLAARMQLRGLDGLAVRLGVTPVVLKGGAHLAAGGEPLDLGDLDVLLPEDRVDAFADALRASGYQPAHGDLGPDAESNHVPALVLPGGILVEVHRAARYGDDVVDGTVESRALAGYAALRQAVAPRALASALHHAIAVHPHRFGHLRDLVLVAALARALAPEDRQAVRDRLAAAPDGPDLSTMLAQADAVGGGAPVPDLGVCRLIAARKYALALGEDALLGQRIPIMSLFSYLGFERASRVRARIARYFGDRVTPNSRWVSRRLARVAPRAARVAGHVVCMVPRLAIVAGALAVTPRALARARRRIRMADALLARGTMSAAAGLAVGA